MSVRNSEVEVNGWTSFDVPNQFEDLQKQLATGSYYIQHVLDVADINTRLQNIARIREPKELLDMFPLFYSIAIHFDKVAINGRSQAVEILLRLTASEMSEAQRRIHIGLGADDRRFHLNIVKMLACLLAEYTVRFDNDQANKSSDFDMPAAKKGKKTKEAESGAKSTLTSDALRDKCLKGLCDILRSHIKPLWDSSIIDEQFVKCVTKPCYHLLRRQDIAKNPIVKDNLPLILTIMINKFEHAREASIQFIQAVKLYDSNSSLLITVLNSLLTDYQDTSLAIELLKEICETNFVAAQADNASAKTMATFIIDMARLDPHIIRTNIDQISDLLTAESHHIRVAALTAFCSVVEKLLSSDDLDEGQRKMRDDLLQILREHVSDVTAFVRQHCLQLWTALVQQKKVPVRQYIRAFELGLDRLRDSACAVRKDAVTLVMYMVLNNPYFVVDSTRAQFEERQNDAETKLAELRVELEKLSKATKEQKANKPKKVESDEEDSGAEDKSTHEEDDEMPVETDHEKTGNDGDESLQETLDRVKLEEQVMRVEEIVTLYKDGLRFMDLIEQANRHVVNLFNSPTLADCKQAVDFFVNLRHYRLVLPNIEQSLRLMFSLIWSADKSICEAITQAFVKIYFDVAPTVPVAHVPLHQARAIIRALKGATFSEELCFEEILKQLIKGKKIATEAITEALWKFYKAPADDNTDVIAGKILSFIVGNEVNTKLNDITDLIQAKEKNRRFVHISCLLLQLAATPKKIENGMRPKQFRLPKTHRLFEILGNIIVSTFHDVSDRQWTPMMESAFDVIFKLADGPIKHIENTIKKLAVKTGVKLGGLFKVPTASQSQPLFVEPMDFENAGSESSQLQASQQQQSQLHHHHHHHHSQTNANSALMLVRFLNCLGKAAVGIVYYVDCTVKDELLRRKEAKQSATASKKSQPKPRKSAKKRTKRKTPDEDDENPSTSINDTTASSSNMTLNSTNNQTIDDDQDDEMCQVFGGAEAEDPVDNEIGLYIQSLCEKNSLLMQYKNILEQILLHPNEYREEALQLSATICLCKFMLLSVELCETHAKMLFDLLKNSTFESVRVAIMVLMNDFYLKYPLAFAAYSNDVYGCLRDRSDNVRLAALKTISNLILKEMVKPKGQISEIALCIIDKHPQIATLATSFFSELAKRQHGEALFNILPDIFSNLVGGGLDRDRQLNEEDFKCIMEFLFKYVSKEKQTESLSEKLCQRFHLADNNPRLWRDLAYIMSKLTYNERALKGLLDHYNYYADKLVEDAVYESFLTIVSNARKLLGNKPDLKVVLDELSTRIEQARSSNGILVAVQQAQQKTKHPAKAPRGAGAKKGGKPAASRSKAKAPQSDDDDDNDDDEDENDENDFKQPSKREVKAPTTTRSKRGAAVTARRKAAVVASDDDDDDDD